MGYAGFLTTQSQESNLETKISTASTDCCAVSGPISDSDVNAVLSAIDQLTPVIVAAMDAIINKKPVFDSVLLATSTVKGDINSLHTKTTSLTSCLTDNGGITPYYVSEIEAAFQRAIAAYA